MKRSGRISDILGTGGIGTGVIYALEGDHTLGRNESRPGKLQDKHDFCKLHIILHYVARLLKDMKTGVRVLPIGAVGEDERGRALLQLMRQAGMSTKHVTALQKARTLHSVCFQYPDNSGGNITESNSASGRVSAAMIRKAVAGLKGKGMMLAAPEVPLSARRELLSQGRKRGAVNVASFVSEEIENACKMNMWRDVDILALNLEEAAALAGVSTRTKPEKIVNACVKRLAKDNPGIRLMVTNGGVGSYGAWQGKQVYLPALKVKVRNTAGAGDASLAGLMIGTVLGLSFLAGRGASCMKLARLLGAISVTSDDTIHFGVNLRSLKAFAKKHRQGKTFG